MNNTDKMYFIVIITLSVVTLSVVAVLLAGLFHPGVDNKEIFETIKPAFSMVIGAFVGFLGGSQLNKKDKDG